MYKVLSYVLIVYLLFISQHISVEAKGVEWVSKFKNGYNMYNSMPKFKEIYTYINKETDILKKVHNIDKESIKAKASDLFRRVAKDFGYTNADIKQLQEEYAKSMSKGYISKAVKVMNSFVDENIRTFVESQLTLEGLPSVQSIYLIYSNLQFIVTELEQLQMSTAKMQQMWLEELADIKEDIESLDKNDLNKDKKLIRRLVRNLNSLVQRIVYNKEELSSKEISHYTATLDSLFNAAITAGRAVLRSGVASPRELWSMGLAGVTHCAAAATSFYLAHEYTQILRPISVILQQVQSCSDEFLENSAQKTVTKRK
jgi:predicted transcriptional regulator